MKQATRFLAVAGIAAAVLVPATAAAAAGPQYTPLTLQNGWTGGPFSTGQPAVALVAGVVTFKGALAGGSTQVMFTLPAADTPTTDVYLHTGLCNAANGRIHIAPTGVADVETDPFDGGTFADAACFTSLDGLSFTLSEKGAKALTLVNGWTDAPFNTSTAAVRTIAGVVRLQGAVNASAPTSDVITTLPKAYWPKDGIFESVDLCGAQHGFIEVDTSGNVSVFTDDPNDFSPAECFVSLDGLNWLKADSKGNAKALTLQNGWQSTSMIRPAGLHASGKVVRFAGAVFGGTGPVVGSIPANDAPATDVYIPALTCGSSVGLGSVNARLHITPSGAILVQPLTGNLNDASCDTIFDGSWFAQ